MTDITDKPINDFEEIIGNATGKPEIAGYRCKLCGDSARYQSLIWHKYGCKHVLTEPKPEKQESVFDGTTYTSSIKEFNEKIKAEPLSEQVLYLAEGINAYLGTLSKELKNMEDSATADCAGTHNVESSAKITVRQCNCGHSKCRYYQLLGIGSFHQGTGFDKEEAELIADLLNKHYMGDAGFTEGVGVDAYAGHDSGAAATSPARLIAANEALTAHISAHPMNYESFADYKRGFFDGYHYAPASSVGVADDRYRRVTSEEHDHLYSIADMAISAPGTLKPEDFGYIVTALEEEGFVIFKDTKEFEDVTEQPVSGALNPQALADMKAEIKYKGLFSTRQQIERLNAETQHLKAENDRLRGLLKSWVVQARSGSWRDTTHLSIQAHPVFDDTINYLEHQPATPLPEEGLWVWQIRKLIMDAMHEYGNKEGRMGYCFAPSECAEITIEALKSANLLRVKS